MRVGQKVKLQTNGYIGLNYENLIEHKWTPGTLVEVIEIDNSYVHPYLIRLPDNTTLRISDRDIKC